MLSAAWSCYESSLTSLCGCSKVLQVLCRAVYGVMILDHALLIFLLPSFSNCLEATTVKPRMEVTIPLWCFFHLWLVVSRIVVLVVVNPVIVQWFMLWVSSCAGSRNCAGRGGWFGWVWWRSRNQIIAWTNQPIRVELWVITSHNDGCNQ